MRNPLKTTTIAVAATLVASVTLAFTQKEARDELDLLAFTDPQLRVVEVNADASGQGEALAAFQEMEAFRSAHGAAWRFTVDLRRGVPTLLGGGAIPMIPGDANDLRWENFAPGCQENACIPLSTVESLARRFMEQNSSIFGVNPSQLEIDPEGSGPIGDTMYFIRFQWKIGGVPVERGSVYFRINRGNLIQVATDGISPIQIDPSPDVSTADARTVVEDYLGPFGGESDRVVDAGSLHIVPVTPAGQDPDRFEGAVGSGAWVGSGVAWPQAVMTKLAMINTAIKRARNFLVNIVYSSPQEGIDFDIWLHVGN